MKATGIVRSIDNLGRIVLPIELRRTLSIREGEPLEIFTQDDYIILKVYQPIQQVETILQKLEQQLTDNYPYNVKNSAMPYINQLKTIVKEGSESPATV